MIAPVPVHCFSITFVSFIRYSHDNGDLVCFHTAINIAIHYRLQVLGCKILQNWMEWQISLCLNIVLMSKNSTSYKALRNPFLAANNAVSFG